VKTENIALVAHYTKINTYTHPPTTMGNEVSRPQLYTRISKALPPLAPQYGPNENIDWVDKGTKAFASEGDREQFICTSGKKKDRTTKRKTSKKIN
jgi:hypothetical protein